MAMVSPKMNTKHVCRRSFAFFLSGLSYIFKECCFKMKSFKKKSILYYVLACVKLTVWGQVCFVVCLFV